MILLDVTFGYPGHPNLFVKLEFGINMDSRGTFGERGGGKGRKGEFIIKF